MYKRQVLFDEPDNRVSSVTEGAVEVSCKSDPIVSTASDKGGVKAGATKGTSELGIPKE